MKTTDKPSVKVVENKLSDGSKTFDVRFVRQGEACLIPMRDQGSAIALCNQISVQIKFGQIL